MTKFTESQLRAAFDAYRDPTDWRAPIDAADVHHDDVAAFVAAVEYFTGTRAEVTQDERGGPIRVKSVGYRLGPCGP